MYDFEVLNHLPKPPFKVTHNGDEGVGGSVSFLLNGFIFWDGSRTVEVDTKMYDAAAGNGVVKFTSPEYKSTIVIRPLTLSDRKLFLNGETIQTLEELTAVAERFIKESIAA